MLPKDYTTTKCLRLMCLPSYTARVYNIVIVHCCNARGCLERVDLLQSVESMKQHYGSFTIPAGTGSRETDFKSHHPIIKSHEHNHISFEIASKIPLAPIS